MVAGGFATGAAGFAGPAIAALLVRPADYSLLLNTICAGLLIVIVLTWWVTRRRAMGNGAVGGMDNMDAL